MRLFFYLFFCFWLLSTLCFFVRFLCAPFSRKVSRQIQRHPWFHGIWGCLALSFFLLYYSLGNPQVMPPQWWERRTQRAKVTERLQAVGGLAALQQDCDLLVKTHRDERFYWFWPETNLLPSSLAALHPSEVRIELGAEAAIVHIKIFGMHATGGHSTPYFGLDVASGTNAVSYRPNPKHIGVIGNRSDSYKKVTDTIFEIY